MHTKFHVASWLRSHFFLGNTSAHFVHRLVKHSLTSMLANRIAIFWKIVTSAMFIDLCLYFKDSLHSLRDKILPPSH